MNLTNGWTSGMNKVCVCTIMNQTNHLHSNKNLRVYNLNAFFLVEYAKKQFCLFLFSRDILESVHNHCQGKWQLRDFISKIATAGAGSFGSARLGSFSIKFKHNHNIQLGPVHPRDCNFELVICTSIKTYQDLTFEVTLWNGRARGVRSSLTATSTQTYFYMKETNQKT